jgi:hypothetical protein
MPEQSPGRVSQNDRTDSGTHITVDTPSPKLAELLSAGSLEAALRKHAGPTWVGVAPWRDAGLGSRRPACSPRCSTWNTQVHFAFRPAHRTRILIPRRSHKCLPTGDRKETNPAGLSGCSRPGDASHAHSPCASTVRIDRARGHPAQAVQPARTSSSERPRRGLNRRLVAPQASTDATWATRPGRIGAPMRVAWGQRENGAAARSGQPATATCPRNRLGCPRSAPQDRDRPTSASRRANGPTPRRAWLPQ